LVWRQRQRHRGSCANGPFAPMRALSSWPPRTDAVLQMALCPPAGTTGGRIAFAIETFDHEIVTWVAIQSSRIAAEMIRNMMLD
jgi:hypothetical protein